MKRILSLLAAMVCSAVAEDISLIIQSQPDKPVDSEAITLNQGDTAKLQFASMSSTITWNFNMVCAIGEKQALVSCFLPGSNPPTINPVTIAGPATIMFRAGTSASAITYLATLQITRSGIASPPAAIPQEAGTKWDVILESSSDLINWTPANPGEYSGTEPKRFFRTRMIKKP